MLSCSSGSSDLVNPQDRLPSENELHREFGLSRGTVRQALELLETNGWAVRVPRRGYSRALRVTTGGSSRAVAGFSRTRSVTATRTCRPLCPGRLSDAAEHAAARYSSTAAGSYPGAPSVPPSPAGPLQHNFSPPAAAQVVAVAADVLSGAGLTHAREGADGCRRHHRWREADAELDRGEGGPCCVSALSPGGPTRSRSTTTRRGFGVIACRSSSTPAHTTPFWRSLLSAGLIRRVSALP